jgi:hypothetical protein
VTNKIDDKRRSFAAAATQQPLKMSAALIHAGMVCHSVGSDGVELSGQEQQETHCSMQPLHLVQQHCDLTNCNNLQVMWHPPCCCAAATAMRGGFGTSLVLLRDLCSSIRIDSLAYCWTPVWHGVCCTIRHRPITND